MNRIVFNGFQFKGTLDKYVARLFVVSGHWISCGTQVGEMIRKSEGRQNVGV